MTLIFDTEEEHANHYSWIRKLILIHPRPLHRSLIWSQHTYLRNRLIIKKEKLNRERTDNHRQE